MKLQPDYSLARDGLPLATWLWRLVDQDGSIRRSAGDSLQAMQWGMPTSDTDFDDMAMFPDTAAQSSRFVEGVETAVSRPEFDTREFVLRFIALKIAMNKDWLERVETDCAKRDARDEKYESAASRIRARIDLADDTGERERANDHLRRLTAVYLAGACDCENDPYADAESLTSVGMAAQAVFDALGPAAMAAPEAIEALLDTANLRFQGLAAIERSGPAAVQFVDRLLVDLDALGEDHTNQHFDSGRALGAIANGDPNTSLRIAERLASSEPAVRNAAAECLAHVDSVPDSVQREVVKRLLTMTHDARCRYFASLAVARLAGSDPSVRSRIVEMASPKPSRLAPLEGFTDYVVDGAMMERSTGIEAMRYLVAYPDECMPSLIEALNSFDEYNSDWSYYGPHARVADVISTFGAAGEPAVRKLAELLSGDGDDYPKAIIEALAAIGPAAVGAIPALRKLRRKEELEDLVDLKTELADRHDDVAGWAIQQIERLPVDPNSRPGGM